MGKRVFVLLTLLCFTLGTGVALAADKVKIPNPKAMLKQVAKNLAKAKSFNVSCDVVGGISTSAKHEVSQVTVDKDYAGNFYRTVMHMPKEGAFRTPKAGAIRNGGNWYKIQSLRAGRMIDRLFQFPQKVLADSLEKPKNVEWIWVGDEQPAVTEEKVEKGGTKVVWDKTKNKGIPHTLRVTLPPKQSLDKFIMVQNSGCISGG